MSFGDTFISSHGLRPHIDVEATILDGDDETSVRDFRVAVFARILPFHGKPLTPEIVNALEKKLQTFFTDSYMMGFTKSHHTVTALVEGSTIRVVLTPRDVVLKTSL